MRRKLRSGGLLPYFEKPIDDPGDSLFTRDLIVQVVQPNWACNVYEWLKCLILVETFDIPVMLVSGSEEPSCRFTGLNEYEQVRTLNNSDVILRQARFLQASANLLENIALATRFEVEGVNPFV